MQVCGELTIPQPTHGSNSRGLEPSIARIAYLLPESIFVGGGVLYLDGFWSPCLSTFNWRGY